MFGYGNSRRGQRAGVLVNVGLRLSIAYFLAEVLRRPGDPRFAGKAIPVRNLLIVGGLSLLFPALHRWRRPWPCYPVWHDNLYLSIFWLDMAGNSLDLYDRVRLFDLLPHAHGTGAVAAVAHGALGLSTLEAAGLATIIHVLLEAQEYYTDVLLGTHNVHGVADTVHDLVAGLAGTALYLGIAASRPRGAAGWLKAMGGHASAQRLFAGRERGATSAFTPGRQVGTETAGC